jgi:toxin ParE1/3/4
MKIVWSHLAVDDRDRIFTYFAEDRVALAIALDERIENAIESLSDFPLRGRVGRVAQTRELVIAQTPFVAAYAIADGKIRILRVLHGARQWPAPPDLWS